MIDATLIVPGDIVHVKAGDRIPADIRVITSSALKVHFYYLTFKLSFLFFFFFLNTFI